ncbi:MAG: histidine phosphatase family protein [Pseudohongiellaceae bacterium]
MTTKRLHLIRHGQTDWNRDKRVQGHAESELTGLGRQQAARLAPVLRLEPITAVHCSSSVRTRQTGEILFRDSALSLSPCDRLREIYLGPWEGRMQAEVRATWPDQFEYFWHRPDRFSLAGAETFQQVQQRALDRIQELLASPDQHIAVVSHGVWIKTLLCAIEDRHLGQLWEPPVMHNCAHSIVEVDDSGSMRIVQYAETADDETSQPEATRR